MRIGVLTFYGSLDDRDASRAIRLAGAEAVPMWFADASVSGVDAIVIPGGATYGNYVRGGAVAAHEPVMEGVREAAAAGVPVLGIGNGFQILVEAGLLPGAFTRNETQRYVGRDVRVRIESTETAWTSDFAAGEEIVLPHRSDEARYVRTDDATRVVARYLDNPNGSEDDIAGVANEHGNVVGLMVHPEFAVEPGFGPDTPVRMRSGVDGLRFFSGLSVAV